MDALLVYKSQYVIIDHCSSSQETNKALSVTGSGCTNATVQWCMITESINRSVHHKCFHGYGSLICNDGNITFHHNIYTHHATRCPSSGTYDKERGPLLDFRNNLIYNWVFYAGYTWDNKVTINYTGNYLKPDPFNLDSNYIFKIGSDKTTIFVKDIFFIKMVMNTFI